MKIPRFNITYKFIGYLMFLSIIPLLIVGATSYQISSNVVMSEASLYIRELVINQHNYLDLQLQQVESLISNLSSVDEIRQVLEGVDTASDTYTILSTQAKTGYILSGYSNLRGLVSIEIFTVEGIHYHVGDTLNTQNIRTDIKDRIFEEALEQGNSIVWVGIDDNVNANSAFSKVVIAAKVLYRINRETLKEEPIALFLVNYSVDHIYNHFSRVNLGQNAYLTVVDGKGRMVYHPDKSRLGQPIDTALEQVITTTNPPPVITLDNVDMSVNFVRSALSNWTIISLIPVETMTAKTTIILRTTIAILLLSFIAVGIVGWIYNRTVVEPIQEITRRFQQTQQGAGHNTPEHVVVRGNDEIAELGHWFNAFMDALEARKKAEEQRLQLAVEREKMHILAHFITEASHEFRTPLSIISSNAYLIRKTTDPAKQTEQTHRIEEQVKDISTLIESLTFMTKLDSGSEDFIISEVNLNEILQVVYYELETKINEKNLCCNLILSDEPIILQADAHYLQHAFHRLWQNSVQYAQSGDSITVATQCDDHEAIISINDTGIGIQPDDFPHIFKRFYRSDKAGTTRGFGLGLPIAQVIIQLHNGTLEIESEPDKGTAITITLPLTYEE